MKYTYKQVLESYTPSKRAQDKQHHLILSYIYRPISFPLTWCALKLGLSANQITHFTILLTVGFPCFFLTNDSRWRLLGVMMMFLYLVLDCVDGNVARIKNTSSKRGEFWDAVAGVLFWTIAFPSLSLGVTTDMLYFGSLQWLVSYSGLLISKLFLLSRFIGQKAKNIAESHSKNTISNTTILNLAKSLPDAVPILYFFSIMISTVDLFFGGFLLYYSVVLIFVICTSYKQVCTSEL